MIDLETGLELLVELAPADVAERSPDTSPDAHIASMSTLYPATESQQDLWEQANVCPSIFKPMHR